MRLFVAINFSEKTKKALDKLRDELRVNSKSGNFTMPGNWHLTLAFLGEVDLAKMEKVIKAMDKLEFAPFDLEINEVGRFPGQQGGIYWAGVKPDDELLKLHSQLCENLAKAGIQLECRRFVPHITLGRKVISAKKGYSFEPFGEKADKISLMESKRIDGQLTYTEIFAKSSNN